MGKGKRKLSETRPDYLVEIYDGDKVIMKVPGSTVFDLQDKGYISIARPSPRGHKYRIRTSPEYTIEQLKSIIEMRVKMFLSKNKGE